MRESRYVQQPEDGDIFPVPKHAPRHDHALKQMAAFKNWTFNRNFCYNAKLRIVRNANLQTTGDFLKLITNVVEGIIRTAR